MIVPGGGLAKPNFLLPVRVFSNLSMRPTHTVPRIQPPEKSPYVRCAPTLRGCLLRAGSAHIGRDVMGICRYGGFRITERQAPTRLLITGPRSVKSDWATLIQSAWSTGSPHSTGLISVDIGPARGPSIHQAVRDSEVFCGER
jgi:hypothetical protein